jgi:hypothetical protein
MARKSLSSQVIEEVDRARGLLQPVQGIVDPMTSHMVGAVLESLHRIESMCIGAMQQQMNVLTGEPPVSVEVVGDEPAPPRRRAAAVTRRPATRKAKS